MRHKRRCLEPEDAPSRSPQPALANASAIATAGGSHLDRGPDEHGGIDADEGPHEDLGQGSGQRHREHGGRRRHGHRQGHVPPRDQRHQVRRRTAFERQDRRTGRQADRQRGSRPTGVASAPPALPPLVRESTSFSLGRGHSTTRPPVLLARGPFPAAPAPRNLPPVPTPVRVFPRARPATLRSDSWSSAVIGQARGHPLTWEHRCHTLGRRPGSQVQVLLVIVSAGGLRWGMIHPPPPREKRRPLHAKAELLTRTAANQGYPSGQGRRELEQPSRGEAQQGLEGARRRISHFGVFWDGDGRGKRTKTARTEDIVRYERDTAPSRTAWPERQKGLES